MSSRSRRFALHAVLAGTLATACASNDPAAPPRVDVAPTCSRADALIASTLRGSTLAAKELALTFDDGPGSRTIELSAWLAAQGISATFFVVGENVVARPGVLAALVADGHAVANHTQHHLDLTSTSAFPPGAGGDAAILAALGETDALIAPFVDAERFLFRAPYGAYGARAHGVLDASAMDKYVGPIGWDIGSERTATTAADWACWQNAPTLTTKACGDLYLAEMNAVGRGIVLMHDLDNGNMSNHALESGVGNTIDMVKYLVPILKAQGFTFVKTADVPEIAALLPPPPPPPPPPDAGDDGGPDGGSDAGIEAGPRDAGTPDAASARDAGASAPPADAPAVAPDPCAKPSARNDDAH